MPNNQEYESWGRYPKIICLGEIAPSCASKVKDVIESVDSQILPRGQGRSYGDSCLIENGYLLSTKYLNKFHSFDENTGLLKCESGVTLDEILRLFVPKGWFLPVTPGTKFVTVGGAIANDVHGKNQHKNGTFGNHVISFELERSNGERIICSRDVNFDLFRATIGGLGLTGVILWAEFKLRKIRGPYIEMESVKFNDIDEFFQISKESERDYEHTVSWVDCLSNADGVRGVFMRGNYSDKQEENDSKIIHNNSKSVTFPFDAPSWMLCTASIKLFNFLFFNKQREKNKISTVHYDPFFYPLDNIQHWNRMYGKRGFLQWQCVLPVAEKKEALKIILEKIIESNMGSFLTTLKEFGDIPTEGLLSFPAPGITLALDFPMKGNQLFSFLEKLDEIVIDFGGRLYPAKDARMSSKTFLSSFAEIDKFNNFIDPKFSSSFYRRVGVK